MAKQTTKFSVDSNLESFALECLKTIPGAICEGVSHIGQNDIRIWYKIRKDTEKEEYDWFAKILPYHEK